MARKYSDCYRERRWIMFKRQISNCHVLLVQRFSSNPIETRWSQGKFHFPSQLQSMQLPSEQIVSCQDRKHQEYGMTWGTTSLSASISFSPMTSPSSTRVNASKKPLSSNYASFDWYPSYSKHRPFHLTNILP